LRLVCVGLHRRWLYNMQRISQLVRSLKTRGYTLHLYTLLLNSLCFSPQPYLSFVTIKIAISTCTKSYFCFLVHFTRFWFERLVKYELHCKRRQPINRGGNKR
jgi:hypothetical protein